MRLDRGGNTEKELTMQKTLLLLTISLVLVLIQGTASAGIPTDAELKAKKMLKDAEVKAVEDAGDEKVKLEAEYDKKIKAIRDGSRIKEEKAIQKLVDRVLE